MSPCISTSLLLPRIPKTIFSSKPYSNFPQSHSCRSGLQLIGPHAASTIHAKPWWAVRVALLQSPGSKQTQMGLLEVVGSDIIMPLLSVSRHHASYTRRHIQALGLLWLLVAVAAEPYRGWAPSPAKMFYTGLSLYWGQPSAPDLPLYICKCFARRSVFLPFALQQFGKRSRHWEPM